MAIALPFRARRFDFRKSNFYYAKRMYAREDMVPGVEGCFLQITGNPSPAAAMPGNMYRKGRGKDAPPESPMTVELRIGPDTAMRVQGAMTPEHLQAIMYGVVGRV